MIEIEIIDTGKRLPTQSKGGIKITFQAADFGKAGSGNGSYSTTSTVPITPFVIEAFGFSTVADLDTELNVYKIIKARLLDGNNEIERGFIRIDNLNNQKREIKFTFFGTNVDWFNSLGDKTLQSIELPQYNHVKNTTTINEVRNEGYVYLPIDYGALTNKNSATITYDEIYPAIWINNIIKQIFKNIGYKVTGTLFENPMFNNIIIPFNSELVERTPEWANYRIITGRNIDANPRFNQPASARTLQPLETKEFKYRPVIDNNLKEVIDGVFYSQEYKIIKIQYKLYPINAQPDDVTFIMKINGNTVFEGNGFTSWSDYWFYPTQTWVINVGDEIKFYLRNNLEEDEITINTFWVYIVPQPNIPQNAAYTLDMFLPPMKQSDLIEWVFFRFGVIPSFDKKTNTVLLDTIQDLNITQVEDWSGLVDASQSFEREYFDIVSNYAKKNNLYYTEDQDDTSLVEYRNKYKIGYGDGSFNIDNDFISSDEDYYTAPFAPTKLKKVFTGVSNLDYYLPFMFKGEDTIPRILLFAGYINVSELSEGIINYITIDGIQRTLVPFAYFINSPYKEGNSFLSNKQLGFGQPLDEPVQMISLLDDTYDKLIKVLNKPKIETVNLKLNAYQVSNLKFNRLKYIQELGGYFYLNKVNQYDGSGEATECELIKWY